MAALSFALVVGTTVKGDRPAAACALLMVGIRQYLPTIIHNFYVYQGSGTNLYIYILLDHFQHLKCLDFFLATFFRFYCFFGPRVVNLKVPCFF